MLSKDKNIETIKQLAEKSFSDCKILLFGSRARGEHKIDSDYDIILVTKETLPPKEKIKFRTLFRNVLAKERIYADIIIQSESKIERKKQIPGNVIYYAIPEAILL